jgi:hypothetical protein
MNNTITDPNTILQIAKSEMQKGNLDLAENIYNNFLRINPNNSEIIYLLGTLKIKKDDTEKGITLIEQSLLLKNNNEYAWNNLGIGYLKKNNIKKAIECFNSALTINPLFENALTNRILAFERNSNHSGIINDYNTLIKINPNNPINYLNIGKTYNQIKEYKKAIPYFAQAISLDSNNFSAFINRGISYKGLNCFVNAYYDFRRASHINPKNFAPYNNLGTINHLLGKYKTAEKYYKKALTCSINNDTILFNLSLIQLVKGRFKDGWKLYEHRWDGNENIKKTKYLHFGFKEPIWDGKTSIKNKKIFVHIEQGFGDTLQFCRYLLLLKGLGAKVLMNSSKPLTRILNTLPIEYTLLDKNVIPPFDLHIPLLSLPYAFQTTLKTIPSFVPYLSTKPHDQLKWFKLLGNKKKPRIGLAWSGSNNHALNHLRSLSLKDLSPLLELPYEFHSLQINYTNDDDNFIRNKKSIINHQTSISDFYDTACLINEMDLVICVDTSVAHLAGALNKPVWIMLQHSPDFRWLLGRNDSPWYPSAKLFRQKIYNNWNSVIESIKKELRNL